MSRVDTPTQIFTRCSSLKFISIIFLGMGFCIQSISGKLLSHKSDLAAPAVALWIVCEAGKNFDAKALHNALATVGPWPPEIKKCATNMSIATETLDEMCHSLYLITKVRVAPCTMYMYLIWFTHL